jgi:hypothetical protein
VLTQRLLSFHIEWLRISIPSTAGESKTPINDILSQAQSAWIYSLLARLEKPLHSDMTAAIRELYRCCCRVRSFLLPPLEGESMALLARLNLLISISGGYFGQGEAESAYWSFPSHLERSQEEEEEEEGSIGEIKDEMDMLSDDGSSDVMMEDLEDDEMCHKRARVDLKSNDQEEMEEGEEREDAND